MSEINIKKVLDEFGLENFDTDNISDGYHTFGSLYRQRLILFAALINSHQNISWKSKRHHDGEIPFGGGWFIVGINTPEGQYTYHYRFEHWNMFACKELDVAPEWDGHTDNDVERLLSIPNISNIPICHEIMEEAKRRVLENL